LRHHSSSQVGEEIDAAHIAQILIAAQRVNEESNIEKEGVDPLFHLGVVQGRWNAVVWIVKRLVETFCGQGLHDNHEAERIFPWKSEQPLWQLTRNEIDLSQDVTIFKSSPISSNIAFTLDELTQDAEEKSGRHEVLRRDCLGQIWRSLGHMTMACADEGMKPEILEIIAYLHHMEIMPLSIYNQRPSPDSTAIQQPPMLRLFSSRILTSLSDAAWRAHEKVVVQEAKAKGGDYASLRPEIPGMAYRIHIAGLRPEVWMELILWSCLHGGWVIDGVNILRMLSLEPPERQWRSLAWRTLAPAEGSKDNDWDKFDYIFNTQAHSEIIKPGSKSVAQIHRTISSEVVNAFIDATLSIIRPTYEHMGVPPVQAIRHLRQMKKLLDRSRLPLSTGSWDAVLVRFFDQQPFVTDHSSHFQRLIALSPVMGEELHAANGQNLPDYVMDPSAAVLGLFHRALLSRVNTGEVEGAFGLFQALQERADSNKHQSIVDFLSKQQLEREDSSRSTDDLFSSYFSGIDYPAFDLQIPATILGPFLDLVTDAKAYDFGKWLLHSYDLDGPVIPERLYGDPALRPALIRFAAETGDSNLLNKLISTQSDLAKPGEPTLPQNVLQSFLNSQVNLKRWDAAERILHHMGRRYAYWSTINLAHVARIMLSEFRSPLSHESDSDFERAKVLFSKMVRGKHKRAMAKYDEQVAMLVTMLASLDPYWANYCLNLDCVDGFYNFDLPTKAFNLALEGVVNAYGSATARRILGLFWPHSVRFAQRADRMSFDEGTDEPTPSTRYVPELGRVERKRQVIRIRGQRELDVVIYGGLRPDLMTIRIIFRKALEELREETSVREPPGFAASYADLAHESDDRNRLDLTASGMVVWAVRCLRAQHMADEDILAELHALLGVHEIPHIRARLSSLFEQADRGDADDDVL
jgi:hypothetical protein